MMTYEVDFRLDPYFAKLVSTDYTSYILQYYCKQEYLDLYRGEVF